MTLPVRFMVSLGFVLATGCTAVLGSDGSTSGVDQSGGPEPGGGDGTVGGVYVPAAPTAAALQARTWKLSNEQYRRSAEAFLGVDVTLVDETGASRLQPDVNSGVFENLAHSGFVSVALATDYYRVAEELTDGLSSTDLGALSPCGMTDRTCLDELLRRAITSAFRRPATDDDVDRYTAIFELADASADILGDPAAGVRAVLRGLLTSPYFLYRTEIGADPAEQDFSLTDFEVASFLSYSILGEPPDADLLGAAQRGELTNPEMLSDTILDLLERPAARSQLMEFLLEWLEVTEFSHEDVVQKDLTTFDEMRPAMLAETISFLEAHASFEGSLGALLTSPVPLPTGALGDFYLSEATSAGANTTRTGVLSLGTLMSINAKEGATSPTLRGVFLRERILCQDFVAPPVIPDIGEVLERAEPRTTREMYELHASQPACAGCHEAIDGVGMTFENMDEMGRFRSTQNGVPIDTSGKLVDTDVDAELRSHTDLALALAGSDWVRECLSRQAFRFYFGLASSAERTADGTREREDRGLPPIQAGLAALQASGTMADLLSAVLTSPSTLARTRFEPHTESP